MFSLKNGETENTLIDAACLFGQTDHHNVFQEKLIFC
jgi:hypothetical protein